MKVYLRNNLNWSKFSLLSFYFTVITFSCLHEKIEVAKVGRPSRWRGEVIGVLVWSSRNRRLAWAWGGLWLVPRSARLLSNGLIKWMEPAHVTSLPQPNKEKNASLTKQKTPRKKHHLSLSIRDPPTSPSASHPT